MSNPVLEVDDLTVTFPGGERAVPAVRGLSFHVDEGEVLGIVGESGSGKSATALAVLGLLPAGARVTGSVRFRGVELLGKADPELSRLRGRRIAMVFQDPSSALTPIFSVGAQVAEALRVHDRRLSRPVANARAVELLDLVGIPDAARRSAAFPHEFSGGMRQRVVIAMAIANQPDLILADEPTTALDVTVQAQVLDVLREAREITGASAVLITHDLGVVAGMADRILVTYAGRAVESGPVDEVFAAPRMPYTSGLLAAAPRPDDVRGRRLLPIEGHPPSATALPPGCAFEPRCGQADDRCAEREPPLVAAGARAVACWRPLATPFEPAATPGNGADPAANGHRAPSGPPVVAVSGMIKRYPARGGSLLRRRSRPVTAVDGVSFTVRPGEALGIVGESGCGKTTTVMEILGLTAPSAGRIEVLGHDVATLDRGRRRAIRRDLQVVFQDPVASLDPRLPVGEVIAEPMAVHGVPRGRRDERVGELLRLVGLDPGHAERFPAEFSGGQRQRIAIARALALEPKVLVLDEPVSALDVSIQAGVINLLDELRHRLGLAYLLVSHDLGVVRHVADRVAVMYLGRIVELAGVDAIFDTSAHPYTRALLSAIPVPDPAVERGRRRILLPGDVPSPLDGGPATGCRFRSRCPLRPRLDAAAQAQCAEIDPQLRRLDPGRSHAGAHEVACHHAGKELP